MISHPRHFVTPERAATITVVIGVVLGVAWLVNGVVAFTGHYSVRIKNFSQLPASLRYVDKTGATYRNQKGYVPLKDRTSFAVTFPRGFVSSSFLLDYRSNPEEVVTLSAEPVPGKEAIAISFRHPKAIPENFVVRQLSGGRMYARDSRLFDTPLTESIKKGKKVVGLGKGALDLITIQTYPATKERTIPLSFRGTNALSAFIPEGEQRISLVKQDLNFTAGEDTYTVKLRLGNKEVFSQVLEDDGLQIGKRGKKQNFQFSVQIPQAGVYVLQLQANNEDSTVTQLSFTGAEINIHSPLFLGTQGKTTVYSACREVIVEAVKQSGLQVAQFASTSFSIDVPKQATTLKKDDLRVAVLRLQRGDVALQSACDFQIDKDQPYRMQLVLLKNKVTLLTRIEPKELAKADIILDTLALPTERNDKLEARADFLLQNLAAKGRTFTFHIDVDGIQSGKDTSVEFAQAKILANRPAFQFSDIINFFQK